MRISWTKTTLGALAAMTLALAVATPASAQYYRGYGGGWHGGYGYGGGGWVGPAVGLGILGGAVAGAAIAGSHPGYYGGECWLQRRPIYDEYGNYLGARRVRICN